jgi:hypothetical protein
MSKFLCCFLMALTLVSHKSHGSFDPWSEENIANMCQSNPCIYQNGTLQPYTCPEGGRDGVDWSGYILTVGGTALGIVALVKTPSFSKKIWESMWLSAYEDRVIRYLNRFLDQGGLLDENGGNISPPRLARFVPEIVPEIVFNKTIKIFSEVNEYNRRSVNPFSEVNVYDDILDNQVKSSSIIFQTSGSSYIKSIAESHKSQDKYLSLATVMEKLLELDRTAVSLLAGLKQNTENTENFESISIGSKIVRQLGKMIHIHNQNNHQITYDSYIKNYVYPLLKKQNDFMMAISDALKNLQEKNERQEDDRAILPRNSSSSSDSPSNPETVVIPQPDRGAEFDSDS